MFLAVIKNTIEESRALKMGTGENKKMECCDGELNQNPLF